ncbi:MAG: RdgB/HAM1 family non-canonical purine NTP pyrophosphatase [Bacteroidota bacterium]|nr:RdgB/HAM1 family non-canonical purine NTP pyrophosphatase [Bacteroidota bacterium]
MGRILIASNNDHKISEINSILKNKSVIELFCLKDFGLPVEVIEDGRTLEENAFKKAREISKIFNIPTLSDDTGLFVDALNGEPGVYSARYSGENASYQDNCKKLLSELENIEVKKRTARFESVLCFYVNDKEFYFFKGICEGIILKRERGKNGFGYDPLFLPEKSDKTFAELDDEEKNKISHRAISLNKFKNFSDSYF